MFRLGLSPIREVQFKGLYIIREYLFSLECVTHVSLRVQSTAVLGTDWPVQHCCYISINIYIIN